MNLEDDNREIERIRQGVTSVWQIWMTWFCWFFGANVLVFWIRGDHEWQTWESACWFTFNVSGVLAAICLAQYCRLARIRSIALLGNRHLGFPTGFAIIGALLNGLALAINSCVWLAVLLKRQ
jgi:hypothetical protein